MPTYDYKCPECAYVGPISHSMFETLQPKCPQCENGLVKVISVPATKFNGSGFYSNDKRL